MPKGQRKGLKGFEDFTEKEAKAVELYTDPESPTFRNKVRSYEGAGYYVAQIPDGQEDDGRANRAARVKAVQLFDRPHIQAEVEKRFELTYKGLQMSIDEVVARISKIAGVDLMEYLVPIKTECPHCECELPDEYSDWTFDIERMRKDGYGFLLQGITPTKYGTKFLFYPADQMLKELTRIKGAAEKSRGPDVSLTYIDKMVQQFQK